MARSSARSSSHDDTVDGGGMYRAFLLSLDTPDMVTGYL